MQAISCTLRGVRRDDNDDDDDDKGARAGAIRNFARWSLPRMAQFAHIQRSQFPVPISLRICVSEHAQDLWTIPKRIG